MKDNKKGSALLWSISVVMILAIAVAGALTISYSYYNRSIRNNSARQAYLTSKGVIEDIVDSIVGNDQNYIAMIDTLSEGQSTAFTVDFKDDYVGDSKGQIDMLPKKDTKGLITITVMTTFGEETSVVKADMQLGNVNGLSNWQLLRYYNSDEVDEVSSNNTKGLALYNHAATLLQRYHQNRNFKTDVLPYLQEDSGRWNIYLQSEHYLVLSYMDNTSLRYFYRYSNENQQYDTFDINEVSVESVIDPLTNSSITLSDAKYFKAPLYMQPFFCNSSYDAVFVYANSSDTPKGFGTGIHFVFNAGHWYYIDSVMVSDFNRDSKDSKAVELKPTHFDDSKNTTTNNYANDRWERFKAKYLTEANRIT